MYKTAFKRLPDRLRKTPTNKLYKIIYSGYNDLDKAFKDIKDSRDIDRAFGYTLDLIGNNVGQAREGLADEEYRLMIKTRIIANLSNGDIPTVDYISRVLLKDNFKGIKETWESKLYENEPAGLVIQLESNIKNIPTKALKRVAAGGVRLYFELFYKDEFIDIAEKQFKLKTKYNLSNRTRTKSRQVSSNVSSLDLLEEYLAIKSKYKLANRAKTRSVLTDIDNKDIAVYEEYKAGKFQYKLAGNYVCGR